MRMLFRIFCAVALFLGWCGSAMSGEVSAYICAVDNCGKEYLEHSQAAAEACRAGVQDAGGQPSSPQCTGMCETTYGPQGKSLMDACVKGCAMFPSACLRAGQVAPKDPKMTRPRTERYTAPPPQRSQPYRDRYYYPGW